MSKKSQVAQAIAKKPGDHTLVDLKLDGRLKPLPLSKFEKAGKKPLPLEILANSLVLSSSSSLVLSSSSSTYAIGSAQAGDKVYYRQGNLGLFGAVFEAWKNHWILRTCPDDWWFPVACRIAKSIDSAAKRGNQKVRDLFVSHDGKENIAVKLPVHTIYQADYDDLFAVFSSELEQRIKKPKYAQTMQNDFSTSVSAHRVESQINLMASMQEFFTYEMMCVGCGLRGLEMEGSEEDWDKLVTKLETLRDILKPIERETGLCADWFDHVINVFKNLAMTRRNPEDPKVAKWWINVLCDTTGTKWVGGGGSRPGRPVEVKAYNGWLIRFLTDEDKILAEDLAGIESSKIRKKLSGFNQVPMKVSLTWCSPPISDESTLVAGMVGFKVHKGEESDGIEPCEAVPSVQPHHMWAMMLPPNSPIRGPSSKD